MAQNPKTFNVYHKHDKETHDLNQLTDMKQENGSKLKDSQCTS